MTKTETKTEVKTEPVTPPAKRKRKVRRVKNEKMKRPKNTYMIFYLDWLKQNKHRLTDTPLTTLSKEAARIYRELPPAEVKLLKAMQLAGKTFEDEPYKSKRKEILTDIASTSTE